MTDKKQRRHNVHPPADPPPAGPVAAEPDQAPQAPPASPSALHAEGASLVELPEQAILRLEGQLDDLKDRHLRLAAEYDNFRKRNLKERAELWARAQADLVQRLVDALDDLARFAHVDPAQTDAKAIHDGVELVERKFRKELDAIGVTRVDEVGVAFDPNLHEAVTTAAAGDPAQDHTVGAILQAGYKIGGTLVRPARVQVLTWQGEAN